MIQKRFRFDNLPDAICHIDELRDILTHTKHTDALLHLYTAGLHQNEAQTILNALDAILPDLKRVGISAYKFYGDLERPLVEFNLLLAATTEFHVVQFPCEVGQESIAAEQCKKYIESVPYLKGIELCPADPSLDVTSFIRQIASGHEDIPIFGYVARPSYAGGDGFGIGRTLLQRGFTIAIYAGKSLNVFMDYILGWNPIGREMTVTLAKKHEGSECAVRLIDGHPAADIYKKYLGLEWKNNDVRNIWTFPLMVHRENTNLCYVPTRCEDGTLYFTGTIYEDEKIRFAYCTREEILDATSNGSKKMQYFAPEAVFISICGNRTGFLKEDSHLELNFYENNNPNLSYCFGFGEISYQNHQGGLLNSAFIAFGLREQDFAIQEKSHCSIVQHTCIDSSDTIPLSYLVSKFFHEMTKELVHLQNHLENEVEQKTQENISLSMHVVQTLAQAIDAKDTYTNGHSSRVAKYSVEIAKRAGYSQKRQREMYMISLLHDVGKIGIPDGIINKPAKLTNDEYAIIKSHPVTGAKILQGIVEMPKLVTGARWHHERFDGSGYPDGLKGDEIPEEARIIAVADAYDAMTSNRSYRKELSQDVVRNEMCKGKGSQFDPRFADIMIQMIDEDTHFDMREK